MQQHSACWLLPEPAVLLTCVACAAPCMHSWMLLQQFSCTTTKSTRMSKALTMQQPSTCRRLPHPAACLTYDACAGPACLSACCCRIFLHHYQEYMDVQHFDDVAALNMLATATTRRPLHSRCLCWPLHAFLHVIAGCSCIATRSTWMCRAFDMAAALSMLATSAVHLTCGACAGPCMLSCMFLQDLPAPLPGVHGC